MSSCAPESASGVQSREPARPGGTERIPGRGPQVQAKGLRDWKVAGGKAPGWGQLGQGGGAPLNVPVGEIARAGPEATTQGQAGEL
jgi:hypothetical protein